MAAGAWAALLFLMGMSVALMFGIILVLRSRARPTAIPRSELAALGGAIRDADQLAADGKVGDGLACLVAGMRRVEQGGQGALPWQRELVERWQAVVEEYASEHRIGPTSEIVPASAPAGRGDEPTPAG